VGGPSTGSAHRSLHCCEKRKPERPRSGRGNLGRPGPPGRGTQNNPPRTNNAPTAPWSAYGLVAAGPGISLEVVNLAPRPAPTPRPSPLPRPPTLCRPAPRPAQPTSVLHAIGDIEESHAGTFGSCRERNGSAIGPVCTLMRRRRTAQFYGATGVPMKSRLPTSIPQCRKMS
jgi:hypothetical protein